MGEFRKKLFGENGVNSGWGYLLVVANSVVWLLSGIDTYLYVLLHGALIGVSLTLFLLSPAWMRVKARIFGPKS